MTLKIQCFAATTSTALEHLTLLLHEVLLSVCSHSVISHDDTLQGAPAHITSALLAANKDVQNFLAVGRQKVRKDLRLPNSLKIEYGTLGKSY